MSGTRLGLHDVVERLAAADLVVEAPDPDPDLTGIADDSRAVAPGDLFCAWAGTEVDAHRFVPAAERAGAAAALVERPVRESGLPQVVVSDGRRAASVAAGRVFGDPTDELLLVGVTGTNGKTTTVWLLRHVLQARYRAASLGTLGVQVGDGVHGSAADALTTPGPVELARTLRGLADDDVRVAAVEVSSHALDQGRVHALQFAGAVFTNISRDHLDYHGSAEAYVAAKCMLGKLLRPDGVAVVNGDDSAWEALAVGPDRRLVYGLEAPALDVRAEQLALDATGATFRLVTPRGAVDVALPLLGEFNVLNALAAAGAAGALGVPLATVADRLATVPQVPGRLERIAEEPCPVLRDYAHTPDALARVLDTLQPLVPGRVIVAFGAGGDRDRGKRPLMGAIARERADVTIVTSDNPRTERSEAIIDEIVAGMAGEPDVREPDRRRAIGRALDLARADDVVLLAGKGHETEQTIGTEKVPFDEREIVRTLWAQRAREAGG